jgi:hypothetical protein
LLVSIACVLGLLLAETARAQSSSTVTAETLFQRGRGLLLEGKPKEACPLLAESLRLDPATGTLIALAMCHEEEGRLASAWAEFTDAAGRAEREGRTDRQQLAEERVAALTGRYSTLVVEVPESVAAIPRLEVRVDGVVTGSATWGVPVPIDGGEHVVEASAPGRVPWKVAIAVKLERDAARVSVPVLAPVGGDGAAATGVSAVPAARSPETDRGRSEPGSAMGTAGLVAAGLGIVGLAAGGYLALDAKSDYEEAEKHCPHRVCEPGPYYTDSESARSQGTMASIVLGVGGAALATGAALWVLAPRATDRPTSALSVERVEVGARGVFVRGSF